MRLPAGAGGTVRSLVRSGPATAKVVQGWVGFELAPITDHDVLVIE